MRFPTVVAAAFLVSAGVALPAQAQDKAKAKAPQKGGANMTFFVTSTGKGNGADLGGLEGADAHCQALAGAAGSKRKNWKAYLSTRPTDKEPGVDARDRIGKGPWRNAKGAVVARNIEDLHGPKSKITKQTALSEKGEPIKARGDTPNEHDILTGSDSAGRYSTAAGDTTCGNWTKNGEGSAIVGHHDRTGLNEFRHSKMWHSSHGSRGCSQENLKSSGGAGLFYCFAAN